MKFKQNLTGGPSIIFRRRVQEGVTFIHEKSKKRSRSILGYDCNSMYAKSMDMDMPVGGFIRRKEEFQYRPIVRDRYLLGYYWMDYLSIKESIFIRHKLNTGREYRCGVYLCDGWCPDITDRGHSKRGDQEQPNNHHNGGGGWEGGGVGGGGCLYEFIGCYAHGHPNCSFSISLKEEERSLRWDRHLEKMKFLKSKHNLVIIFECEFMKQLSMDKDMMTYVRSRRPEFFQKHKGPVTMKTILEAVEKDKLFGMLEVSLMVPDTWPSGKERDETPYEYFHDMSPIFCTTEVPFEVIGSHMQEHAKKYNISQKPRILLVGGMKAEKILLASKLLQWYLKHGIVVTRIYEVIEFCRDRCFSDFIKDVKDARREASSEEGGETRALNMKLLCNSSYGGILLQKNKHKNIKYIKGNQKAKLCANDRRFYSMCTLDEENQLFEVSSFKQSINMNLPIHVGFCILQYAKLTLLRMYYDFLKEFVKEDSFSLIHTDTDSCYIQISEENLIDVIKPEKFKEFYKAVYDSCDDTITIEPGENNYFLTRQCCEKHRKYDDKEPGLFKQEYGKGRESIGLSSKSYILISGKHIESSNISVQELYRQHLLNKSRKIKSRSIMKRIKNHKEKPTKCIKWDYKLVSKGVSKRGVKNPVYIYRRVIKTQERQSSVNKGIRLYDNDVYSYAQNKSAFSYFYIKRCVSDCGINTSPLNLTLRPLNRPLENFSLELFGQNQGETDATLFED